MQLLALPCESQDLALVNIDDATPDQEDEH